MSVDPLSPDYPWYTPYQFAGNMPIWAIDLHGLEEAPSTSWKTAGGNMEYNSDGNYFRFQRAEGDMLKTWITNAENTDWVYMGAKRDPATYYSGGLSLDNYIKSDYTNSPWRFKQPFSRNW
ncbi:MAG: hypothetical protein D6772_09825 [Bacteroidetes bacterium]|nr:MAG: hypothetical protein D6772_09825 [Bacteroidota bacterium]